MENMPNEYTSASLAVLAGLANNRNRPKQNIGTDGDEILAILSPHHPPNLLIIIDQIRNNAYEWISNQYIS